MNSKIKNLVFEGGGILCIAYLGALDYLDEIEILPNIEKVAGSSGGALTACLVSFNLPFVELKKLASSLDYKKINHNDDINVRSISNDLKDEFKRNFGDISSIYRLVNSYGWYSTKYMYSWIKKTIEKQFDKKKKKPPYTFEDFKNEDIHIDDRDFKDLYITGTDITNEKSVIFSYDTTPKMEVAEAIKISMSTPLFFEATKVAQEFRGNSVNFIYADGGIMKNYPINIFDNYGFNYETLGLRLDNKTKYSNINNISDYIRNLFHTLLKAQEESYNHNIMDHSRTININTGGLSTLDFNICENDCKFLYQQGYDTAVDFFESGNNMLH